MSLLLLDSRYNRDFVRANLDLMVERFRCPDGAPSSSFEQGTDPSGNSIILV